jgi:acetoin utilization deacetylase AcuC-like enzyme
MPTLHLSHPACLKHDTGPGHPERPDRLRAIEKALAEPQFAKLVRFEAPRADLATLELVHTKAHIEAIRADEPTDPNTPRDFIDAERPVHVGSFEAALRSAGAAVEAVDQVMGGKYANAFCATRPPGHHASAENAEGFCLFSNAAIAAKHARAKHGAERVAVIDFDVHHGNGTQAVFWDQKDLFYASTHQMPLYPGTGAVRETGLFNNICNAPLRDGDGRGPFREAFDARILPAMRNFGFDLLIISAGFDAHKDDPLGGLQLVEDDFAWVTHKLVDMAVSRCHGRVVSVLEGGYDLGGLSRSVAAHVGVLMEASS